MCVRVLVIEGESEVEQELHSGMKTEAQRATESLNVTQEFQTTYGFDKSLQGESRQYLFFHWADESKRENI